MNDVDTRLQRAAAEVRQVADRLAPPGIRSAEPFKWAKPMAFAVAFAAVIVAVGIIPVLSGLFEESEPVGTPPVPTSTAPVDPPSCATAGVGTPPSQDGVPEAVEAIRVAIFAAASECDFEALARLAAPGFISDFGGGSAEVIARWGEDGGQQLETLLAFLGMSHGIVAPPDGPVIYVWPSAFAYDTWDEIPDEALAELGAVYTEEDLDSLSTFGAYAGWRAGIDDEGNWLFFVAGD